MWRIILFDISILVLLFVYLVFDFFTIIIQLVPVFIRYIILKIKNCYYFTGGTWYYVSTPDTILGLFDYYCVIYCTDPRY